MLKIVLRTSAQRMRQNSALPGRRSREWRRPWRNSGRKTKLCGSALPSRRRAQAAASVRAEGSDKLQQLTRKLEAAHAEIRRYQTRLFACERQMIALRRENADLEAACEQAREELQMAVARAEKAEQQAAQEACLSGSAGAGPDAGTARRSCGLLCKTGRTACGAAGTRVAAGNGAGEAFGGAAAPV